MEHCVAALNCLLDRLSVEYAPVDEVDVLSTLERLSVSPR
nr:MAG: hypothetical protein J07AB56_11220 [Candidatus Nanosalinarum sp. J07AB56]